ncbi:MAG: hypothetical protein AAF411_25200 [Myxococcota bacterium]
MSARAHIVVDGEALAGANFGIDVDATVSAFCQRVRRALAQRFPELDVSATPGPGNRVSVECDDPDERARIAREIELVLYGVRKAADYIVYA